MRWRAACSIMYQRQHLKPAGECCSVSSRLRLCLPACLSCGPSTVTAADLPLLRRADVWLNFHPVHRAFMLSLFLCPSGCWIFQMRTHPSFLSLPYFCVFLCALSTVFLLAKFKPDLDVFSVVRVRGKFTHVHFWILKVIVMCTVGLTSISIHDQCATSSLSNERLRNLLRILLQQSG